MRLSEEDWSLYDAFVEHCGNFPAICAALKIRPQDINRWYASPAVRQQLAAFKSMIALGVFARSSLSIYTAIDELERQLATITDNPERRKCAAMLSRIEIAQAPVAREHKSGANNAGEAKNPAPPNHEEARFQAAFNKHFVNHPSIRDPRRFTAPTAPPYNSVPPAANSDPSFKSEISHSSFTLTPHPKIHEPKSEISSPLDASSSHAPMPSAAPSSDLCESVSSGAASFPQSDIPHPTSDVPNDSATSCLRGSVPSRLPYSPANLPEPPFTQELLNSLDDATFYTLFDKHYRHPEKQEQWCVVFPSVDPDDATPFPKHDPSVFPAPSRWTDVPKDLSSSLGYTDNDYLVIARQEDPFWMLPKDRRGNPNRRKFSLDERHIYRNLVACIHRAHGIACSVREYALEQAQRELENTS